MSVLAVKNGGVIVGVSGGLCVGCCAANIILTNLRVGGGIRNTCGVQGEDNVGWRNIDAVNTYRNCYRTESMFYYATTTGLRRYTSGRNFIDHLTSLYCYDVCADSAGSMYIAHKNPANHTVTKLNSAGVEQWTFDTELGDPGNGDAFVIALSYDETKVAVGTDEWGAADKLFVLNTTTGAEIWRAAWNGRGCQGVDFDAFGNVYAVREITVGGNDRTTKYDPAGAIVWTYTGINTDTFGVVTDSTYVYIVREILGGAVRALHCVTVAENPAAPGFPAVVYTVARGGNAVCLDEDGRLFLGQNDGVLWEADPSNGDILWSMTGAEVWNNALAFNRRTDDMHAGNNPVPLPWACNVNFIAGDIRSHDAVVYESILAHISCGDVLWAAGVHTIGDRVFYPSQDENNAYRLTNNNKTGADTDAPGVDADWIEDNDEPGSGNNWTDYWQAAA